MSTVSYNLANFRTMSEQSKRNNDNLKAKTADKKVAIASNEANNKNAQSKNVLVNNAKLVMSTVPEGAQSQRDERNNVVNKQTLKETKCNHSPLDVKAVHEDIKKSYVANPNVPVDEEAEYYETIRRLDVCGHCWCGERKYYTAPFKLKAKGPGTTLYQKDFVEHPLTGKAPVVKNDFYGTFNIEEPMELGTTMRNDFKPYNVQAPERATMPGKSSVTGVPFAGRSGYKAEYINWGKQPVNFEKAPHNITVIKELPFSGKTAYVETYGNYKPSQPARPVDRDLWKHNAKSPLSPGIPFLGQTTHSETYKPYKVGGAPMFLAKEEYEPTEAYPNQFKSTYKQEYSAPKNEKCPARVFMDAHPNPRSKTLKF